MSAEKVYWSLVTDLTLPTPCSRYVGHLGPMRLEVSVDTHGGTPGWSSRLNGAGDLFWFRTPESAMDDVVKRAMPLFRAHRQQVEDHRLAGLTLGLTTGETGVHEEIVS